MIVERDGQGYAEWPVETDNGAHGLEKLSLPIAFLLYAAERSQTWGEFRRLVFDLTHELRDAGKEKAAGVGR